MYSQSRAKSPVLFAGIVATVVTLLVLGVLLALSACTDLGAAQPGAGAGDSNIVAAHPGDDFGDEAIPAPGDFSDLGDGSIQDETGIPVDANHSAIVGLEPAVREALQAAAARALGEGIELRVSSGWRSAELQDRLLQDAIDTYGSEDEARMWVDTPERSSHVTGQAVDIGGLEESLWMGQFGGEFGLCQTFANERWHFELSDTQPDGTCPPAPYASAAERP